MSSGSSPFFPSFSLKCECGVFQMWKQQKTVVSWCVETRCAMPVSAPCANITTFLCLCPLPPDWPSLPHPPVRLLPLTGTCTDVPAPFFSVLCDWPMTGHRWMSNRLKLRRRITSCLLRPIVQIIVFYPILKMTWFCSCINSSFWGFLKYFL